MLMAFAFEAALGEKHLGEKHLDKISKTKLPRLPIMLCVIMV